MDWSVFIFAHLFGLFDQLFIVFSNDYFDQDTDARNANFNIFTGGSRVLVDGEIQPGAMKLAFLVMAALTLLCTVPLVFLSDAVFAPLFAIVGLLLMVMYSFPPVRLSYRGGGELLQALGVGLVLPTFGYYAQAGNLQVFPFELLWIFLPTQLACALSTTLPDYKSDRESKKRTLSVLITPVRVRPVIVGLQCVAIYGLGVYAGLGRFMTSLFFLVLFAMITVAYWPVEPEKKPVIYVGLNIFLTTAITLASLHILLAF
jgi:1,4-dihydroxy-2-naphthoate octaprenyltransferase